MRNRLHISKRPGRLKRRYMRVAWITLPVIFLASGNFPCPNAFGFDNERTRQGRVEAGSISAQDYSYYDSDYDDQQNDRYTIAALTEQSRRSLTTLSYNHLAWLRGFSTETLGTSLKEQWQNQRDILRKALRIRGNSPDKSKAVKAYFGFLHATLSDTSINLIINRHREFQSNYKRITKRLHEDYQMFSSSQEMQTREQELNPHYYYECLEAERQISKISKILHEMELTYNNRPTLEDQESGTPLNSWVLWRLSLPHFLQKIYDHATGNLRNIPPAP